MGWSLSGTYMESCNCEAACPCVFLGPPTEGECTVLIAWHVDRGSFAPRGDLLARIAGVAMVAAGVWMIAR